MAFKIIHYKPELGRYVRGTAFWLLGGMAYKGALSFYVFISFDWAKEVIGGMVVPVLEIPVSIGFLITVAVFLLMLLGIRYAINTAKLGDLLIDTEAELKRVTWPSWPETWNGSVVVIITVISMLVLLAGADMLLARVFGILIF